MTVTFSVLGPGEYERAKKILNAAKHPGFVGREAFFRCATTGAVTVAQIDDQDVAIAMVAKNMLKALSVVTRAQGSGVGKSILAHTNPRFASVIGDKQSWFEKLGYRAVGPPKVGQNGKHLTQLMELSGEQAVADLSSIALKPSDDASPAQEELESLFSLLDENASSAKLETRLRMLDQLYRRAVQSNHFRDAREIMIEAETLIAMEESESSS